MTNPFSQDWHHVKGLRPRLAPHVRFNRHKYRGETAYVVQDAQGGHFLKLEPEAYRLLWWCTGEQTVGEIAAALARGGEQQALNQNQLLLLINSLYEGNAIVFDRNPDTHSFVSGTVRQKRKQFFSRLINPLSQKVHLWNPDRFLRRLDRALPFLKSSLFSMAWAVLVLPVLLLTYLYWDDVLYEMQRSFDSVLSNPGLLVAFILVKLVHELGHGIVARHYGASVTDMGINFIVFAPIPYVDASATWALRNKYQRAKVAAAGMFAELMVSSAAFYIWLSVEGGMVSYYAFNIFLMSSVTTLFFNANPLVKFDGYYILSDLIEMPNLKKRSDGYIAQVVSRFFGLRVGTKTDVADGRERRILVSYFVLSQLYRVVIIATIVLFLLDIHFVIGSLLAALTILMWIVIPFFKLLDFLVQRHRLRDIRGGRIYLGYTTAVILIACFFLVPVPHRAVLSGVLDLPDDATVRSPVSGALTALPVTDRSVAEGDLLVAVNDPSLVHEIKRLEARLRELRTRQFDVLNRSAVEQKIIEDEIKYAKSLLAEIETRAASQDVRSQKAGEVIIDPAFQTRGAFATRGQRMGYVLSENTRVYVKAEFPQTLFGLVNSELQGVEVRFVPDIGTEFVAERLSLIPIEIVEDGGGKGGKTRRDDASPSMRRYELTVAVPDFNDLPRPGTGARVRLSFEDETLYGQVVLALKQLFISRFGGQGVFG